VGLSGAWAYTRKIHAMQSLIIPSLFDLIGNRKVSRGELKDLIARLSAIRQRIFPFRTRLSGNRYQPISTVSGAFPRPHP
jgi:hypothetical protein